MALRHDFTADDEIFAGEDKKVRYAIYEADKVTPKNVAGWGLEWTLNGSDKVPKLKKTTPSGIAVEGTFDVDPLVNTQRVVVTVNDEDTITRPAGMYKHKLRRTDEGSKAVLSYGNFPLLDS